MNRTRVLDFMKGLIVMGVAFAFLWSFAWFQTLVKNLLIGFTVLAVGYLGWAGYSLLRRYKER